MLYIELNQLVTVRKVHKPGHRLLYGTKYLRYTISFVVNIYLIILLMFSRWLIR